MITPNGHPAVAITGAGGFVMRSVVSVLAQAGFNVVAIDQHFSPSLRARWHNQPITLMEADATYLPDMGSIDTLILGAAITATPEEVNLTPEDYYRQQMLMMQHGLEWSRQHSVRRVIAISSSAVYAETEGAVDEDTPLTPVGLYAVAKANTEMLFTSLKRDHHMDCAVVRLSNIYGPDEVSSATRPRISIVGQLIAQALTTGIIHPINEPARDWTLSVDVGHALLALINTPMLAHAVYNVASEQHLTTATIANLIQAVLPDATIGDPVDAQYALTRRGWLTHSRLHTDTGFDHWTPLASGLHQTIEAQRALLKEQVS